MSEIGQCRHCMKRREVFPAQRNGGGSYKRGGRWYNTRICAECARKLLQWANPGQRTVSRLSVSSLEKIRHETADA